MKNLQITNHDFNCKNLDNIQPYKIKDKIEFQYYIRTHIIQMFKNLGFKTDGNIITNKDGESFEISYYITKEQEEKTDIDSYLID